MKFFEVRRTIDGSPEQIWAILTDAQRLATSDLGILRIEGEIKPSATFKLWSEAAPRAFRLKVTGFSPCREMVWSSGMPAGLFTGRRRFTLTPVAAGTDFHMREEYTGRLLNLIWPSIPDLNPSFAKFASGLANALELERK